MTQTYAIQSGIEIVILALIFVGVFNEEKIAKWEKKFFPKLKKTISRKKSQP